MNCRERQEFFSDLYDGQLPADRRRDLEAHLGSCADCRPEYEVFSASLHALRESRGHVPGEGFTRRVLEAARGERERQALFQNTGIRRPTTRRMAAPRTAAWALPAVAASLVAAFGLGFLVQKRAADQQIQGLNEVLAKSKSDKPVEPAKSSDQPSPPPEDTASVLKRLGIVRAAGGWVSREIQERLERDEMLVNGQWVDRKKFIGERVQEELAKNPGTPDVAAAEDRVLARFGLVKRGEFMIPRAWDEAFNRGQVVDPAGGARHLEELQGEWLRSLGLVNVDGRVISGAEWIQLLAARKIQKGEFPAEPTPVTRALDGLTIGPALWFRNLMLYPLAAPGDRTLGVTTLPEAFAADRVEIVEVNALQVRVKNKGETDLALFAGELLVGGRHDRVVARDAVVSAKKDRIVEVYDVDPAQLRAPDKTEFLKAGGSGTRWAPLGLRRLLNHEEASQAGVWAALLGPGERTTPLELYREHKTAIAEFRAALQDLRARDPRMVGVAVVVGDSIAALEVFGSPALLAANFDRLLESAAVEAILPGEPRYPSDFSASPLGVKRLAESAFLAENDVEGDSIVMRRNGHHLGRALVAGGELVRVVLFPEGPPPMRPPLDVAVLPTKVAHVLKAYEARLVAPNGGRKAAVLREMAMLPGDRPCERLLERLKDPALRRDVVEALGLRGDANAVESLLGLLKESRKDPAMYSALAQALSRIGGEEALKALLQDLDTKSPDIARLAAEHLPPLMAGLKRQGDFEKSMGSLIQSLSRFDMMPDSKGLPWPHRTLTLLTGKSFAKTTEYLVWWNNPKDRAEFLERHWKP